MKAIQMGTPQLGDVVLLIGTYFSLLLANIVNNDITFVAGLLVSAGALFHYITSGIKNLRKKKEKDE